MPSNRDHEDHHRTLQEDDNGLPVPPDGGYGWVIVAVSFFCNMIVDGISYTFGMFLLDIADHYGESKGTAAWVGSVLTGTYLIAGPLVGVLTNRFGCRAVCVTGSLISTLAFSLSIFSPSIYWLMLTYGFFGGLGLGFMYLPAIVCVGYYFEGKRSLATGVAVCGSGLGTFAFAPLGEFLLDEFGWKGANLILAGIIFNGAACGALMRPLELQPTPAATTARVVYERAQSEGNLSLRSLRKEKHQYLQPLSRKDVYYSGSIRHLPEYQSQMSLAGYRRSVMSIPRLESEKEKPLLANLIDFALFKDPLFMLISISSFFGMAGIYIPFVYIVDCAESVGLTLTEASSLISVAGIVNMIFRIVCGYLSDLPKVNSLLVNNVCLAIGCVSIAFVPFCKSYASFVTVLLFFAVAVSGNIALSSIIIVDLLGLDKLTNAFGTLILFRGLAALLSSPIAGFLYDATQSYDWPFYSASIVFAMSLLSSLIIPCFQKNNEGKTGRNAEVGQDLS